MMYQPSHLSDDQHRLLMEYATVVSLLAQEQERNAALEARLAALELQARKPGIVLDPLPPAPEDA